METLQNEKRDDNPNVLTIKVFKDMFQEKLGEFYPRAAVVFAEYGERLSFDVANVLLCAIDDDKVEDVLAELEKHWEEHLSFQHPDIRGMVSDSLLGVNKTEAMFLRIMSKLRSTQKTEDRRVNKRDDEDFWELCQRIAEEEFAKLNVGADARLIGFSYVGKEFQLIFMTPGGDRRRETFWKNARGILEKLLQK